MRRLWQNIKFLRWSDFLAGLKFFLALLILPFFKLSKKEFYLFCESENEARDNAFFLFKYIIENHPETKVYFALGQSSPDRSLVEAVSSNIVNYGSLKHWLYYLAARYNVSSQKAGKPNAAICYFLEIYGLIKNKSVFLQHGITISKAKWLFYENTKMRLFVCGAKPEYEAVKKDFGYPEGNVQYLGFPRFDHLHDFQLKNKQILLMPTWRSWLRRKTDAYAQIMGGDDLTESKYFIAWNSFLNSQRLVQFLEENELDLIFYPHREMQEFLDFFDCHAKRITVASAASHDVQTLLKESAFLITDYSSVCMDFAYMKKPAVYYQFDEADFRLGQYEEGYFDYEQDGFAPLVKTESELLQVLEDSFAQNFQLDTVYEQRVEAFFPLYDQANSERNYQAIMRLEK